MYDNPADEQNDRTLPLFGSFFGAKGRQLMKLFFCVAHYPVTLVYAVSLINALSHFLTERLHFTGFNRATLTLVVLAILHLVLSKGRDKVVSTMSALALPFAIAIIVVAASDSGLGFQQYRPCVAINPFNVGQQFSEGFVVNPTADCFLAVLRAAVTTGFLVSRTWQRWRDAVRSCYSARLWFDFLQYSLFRTELYFEHPARNV